MTELANSILFDIAVSILIYFLADLIKLENKKLMITITFLIFMIVNHIVHFTGV